MLRTILTALVLSATALPATAQSWCSGNNLNDTERVICRDEILGNLDREMTDLYRQNKLEGQLAWLRKRNACGSRVFCIEDLYNSRIAEMQAALEELNNPKLRPWCGIDGLNSTEQTICARPRLANLDAAMVAVYRAGEARDKDPAQERWRTDRRDACGNDRFCIEEAYVTRIISLGKRLRLEGK